MNALLICPDRQPAVALLSATVPLACTPLLGQSPLECWLGELASRGATHVHVLASDRPEIVQAVADEGRRWGMRVDVESVAEEHSPDTARVRYCPKDGQVVRIDHLPGQPDLNLFTNYAAWFAALSAWIPRAQSPLRIGVREIAPGVWTGSHTHIAAGAQIRGPVWIGAHVRIGPNAVIGPRAVIEDRAWVDRDAVVVDSAVAPDTFVGGLCELNESLASGSTLVNWRDNTCMEVSDSFLMCRLGTAPSQEPATHGWKFRFPWATRHARPALPSISIINPQ